MTTRQSTPHTHEYGAWFGTINKFVAGERFGMRCECGEFFGKPQLRNRRIEKFGCSRVVELTSGDAYYAGVTR